MRALLVLCSALCHIQRVCQVASIDLPCVIYPFLFTCQPLFLLCKCDLKFSLYFSLFTSIYTNPFKFSTTTNATGYDNELESMGAIFLATGPAFKSGKVETPRSLSLSLS